MQGQAEPFLTPNCYYGIFFPEIFMKRVEFIACEGLGVCGTAFGVDFVRMCVGLLPLGNQNWSAVVLGISVSRFAGRGHMDQLLSQAGRCFGGAHGIFMGWLVTPSLCL